MHAYNDNKSAYLSINNTQEILHSNIPIILTLFHFLSFCSAPFYIFPKNFPVVR